MTELVDIEPVLDGRENIELRLEREELFNLMLMAHERDITLNQLVEQILRERIEQSPELTA